MVTSVATRTAVFRRVVVLLDGSPAAEEIISHLQRMIDAIEEILLLHVVPAITLPIGASPTIPFKVASDAEHYLLKIQSNAPRARVRLRVEVGNVVEQIEAVCREEGADLIAFTTHSKHGLGSMLFGSVARALVQDMTTPILIARPGLPRTPKALRHILVPLWTNPDEQKLLVPVYRLARRLGSEVHLLRVNPVVVSKDPVTGAILPIPFGPAPSAPQLSLESVSRTMPGIHTEILTADGEVAPTILEQARVVQADLIAMNTHSRRGLDRFLSGSFSEDVLKKCDTPILLQHLPQSDS